MSIHLGCTTGYKERPSTTHGEKELIYWAPTLLLGMKVASGTVENSMEDPQKTKSRITLYSSNPTPGHIYAQNDTPKKDMYPYIHSSTIHNSQTWKQCNVHRQMNGCGTWR